MPPAATSTPHVLEQALYAAFLAVLVWAPLPFASNRPWAWSLLALLLFLILAGWLLLFAFGKVSLAPATARRVRWPLALLLLVQAWVALQMLPLPREWVAVLSPQAYEWHIREGPLPISLDIYATRDYLLKGCSYTVGFLLALLLVNSHRRLQLLLGTLVFSGTFQAAYGGFMVMSGLEYGFLVEKYAGRGVATGTFVNRNHLAGYLVMCLAAGIGLLLSQLDPRSYHGWRDRLRSWLRLMLSPKIRLRLYLAVMVIALVLTRSRMGNIAFFASLSVAGLLYLVVQQRFNRKMLVFLGSLLLVDLLILGRWFGLDKLVERLEQTNPQDLEVRAFSNDYSLDMLAHFPLTGSGGGSYYGVFPNFQGEDLPGYYDHAHNDYLEFAAELGIPALLCLALVVGMAFYQALRVLRLRQSRLYRGAAFAVIMAITWCALHSTVDFNLQIPANGLLFATLMGMAFTLRELPHNPQRVKPDA